MKKRKSPIALITVLVVMASVVFGMQYVASKGASPADQAPAPQVEDAKPVGEARPAESSSSVAASVRGATRSTEAAPAAMGGKPTGRPGASSTPLILNAAPAASKPEKPKPNSSSTSAQWYNDESALGAHKD